MHFILIHLLQMSVTVFIVLIGLRATEDLCPGAKRQRLEHLLTSCMTPSPGFLRKDFTFVFKGQNSTARFGGVKGGVLFGLT